MWYTDAMRDSQKSKVYAAESAVCRSIDMADSTGVRTCEVFGSLLELPVEYKFRTLEDVEHYCAQVLARIGWDGPRVNVYPAHPNQSKAHHLGTGIYLPDREKESWAWREMVVLHELAHHITPGDAHGARFAGAMVSLVGEAIGPEAAMLLRSAYLDTGVVFSERQSHMV